LGGNLIRDPYHRFLPEWLHIPEDSLVRFDGPVLQGICWERLSGGTYRPMNFMRALVSPEPQSKGGAGFWMQIPKGSPGTVSLRWHSEKLVAMFETMKREFKPLIVQPLDANEVLGLAECEAVPTCQEAYALAGLNAYLGHAGRALCWCQRYDSLVDSVGLPWNDLDRAQRRFLDTLVRWIEAGEAKRQLDVVLQEERRKWEVE
jgi:hypothetical protein